MLHTIIGANDVRAAVKRLIRLTVGKRVVVVDVAVLCISREQVRVRIAARVIVTFLHASLVRGMTPHAHGIEVCVRVSTSHGIPGQESAIASDEALATIRA
jgi:hypothetical protein